MKESKKDYIIIPKEKLVNGFFISILLIAGIVFCVLLIKSASSIQTNPNDLDASLISMYHDDFLNLTYGVPGGDWGLGEIDTTGIETTVKESMGEDNYFSIETDSLTEEVLSSILFTNQGQEGFRQFMSYTFKPSVAYKDLEYVEYCKDSFKRDIEKSGDYKDISFISAIQNEYDGVFLKMNVTQTVEKEDENGEKVTEDAVLYYTQYIKRIGKNMATITFGSVIEDNTVDPYLVYFLNNVTMDTTES